MTNHLDPEGLENVADAIWMHANGEHGVCDDDRRSVAYRVCLDMAEKFITAYLVATPDENPLGRVRDVVDDLHATSAISQDIADQLYEALGDNK